MNVVLCGNSHVGALRRGILPRHERPGLSLSIFPIGKGRYEADEFSRRDGSCVSLTTPEYAANMVRFTGRNAITAESTWGFLHVNSNTRIYRDVMWRTSEPASIAVHGTTPVSDDMLRAMVVRQQRGVRDLFAKLQEAGINFFAISGPFPRQDLPELNGRIRPVVVTYLDQFARSEWRRWLGERGIPLIEPPPETVTSEGLLRTEFNAPDFPNGNLDRLHANPAYGAVILDQVVTHLAGRPMTETLVAADGC